MSNIVGLKMNTEISDIKYLFPSDTKIINFAGSSDKYTALLRSKCKSKEEFRQNWLKQYEKLSRVSMRVLLTRPKIGKTVVYKAAFRCQHNTYPASHQRVKAPHRKHTGCPAILKVTIKASPENRRVRSIDTLRREYPTIISINHDHNHHLPNCINLVNDYYNDGEKTKPNFSELCRNTVKNSQLEVNQKEEIFEVEYDWNSLKKCWTLFIEKWESSNSIHLYKAILKAINCLEDCKTVNATISALNSLGKKVNKRKCNTKVLTHPRSIASSKTHCNVQNNFKQGFSTKLEISNAVDELLVIDQGWVM